MPSAGATLFFSIMRMSVIMSLWQKWHEWQGKLIRPCQSACILKSTCFPRCRASFDTIFPPVSGGKQVLTRPFKSRSIQAGTKISPPSSPALRTAALCRFARVGTYLTKSHQALQAQLTRTPSKRQAARAFPCQWVRLVKVSWREITPQLECEEWCKKQCDLLIIVKYVAYYVAYFSIIIGFRVWSCLINNHPFFSKKGCYSMKPSHQASMEAAREWLGTAVHLDLRLSAVGRLASTHHRSPWLANLDSPSWKTMKHGECHGIL